MLTVAGDWVRPYRAGVVWQVVWWLDVVFAAVIGTTGTILFVAGVAALEPPVALFAMFVLVFSLTIGIGAWRLLHLGVWTGTDGVEIRTIAKNAQRLPWSAVERFEVGRGRSLWPFVRPAPQVSVVVRGHPPVLVPGLWRRSPFTWGGVGPDRIVEELNQRRPDVASRS